MPNDSDYFGGRSLFDSVPRNHTIEDIAEFLRNISSLIDTTDSGEQSPANTTLVELCKAFYIETTPAEVRQIQSNESSPTLHPEDASFLNSCFDVLDYNNFVANYLCGANSTCVNNKADNDCNTYLLVVNGLLLGLVVLLGIRCLFYYKSSCSRQRIRTARDSPLLAQGACVNDGPDLGQIEQQECVSGNQR